MKMLKKITVLFFFLLIIFLAYKKPKKKSCIYTPYFLQLNQSIKENNKGASHAIIDLNRLDNNIEIVQKNLGNRFRLRLVTKSLPSFDLLNYLMQQTNTNRLMLFSEPFIAELLDTYNADSLDILLGKPLPVDAVNRLSVKNGWHNIHWLIDTEKRLLEYIQLAKEKGIRLYVALEINVGLQRGGFDSPEKMIKAIEILRANQKYVQLAGLMGYDGHVPYVPVYINKQKKIVKAFSETQKKYNQFVDRLKKYYNPNELNAMTLNSGGSRTYFYYKDYKMKCSVNDIAIGSGFLSPSAFPELYKYGHLPALYLASPVLKKIETSLLPHAEKISPLVNFWNPNLKVSYFMMGGGWPGNLAAPQGIQKNSFWEDEGKGFANLLPNQSIFSSSDENTIQIDDFIFTQPWEGDGMLCFSKLLLYKNGKIIDRWKTYNGGN